MKVIGLFEPDLVTNGIGLHSRLLDPPLAGKRLIDWVAEGIAACKSIGKTVAVVSPRDEPVVSDWLEHDGSGCRVIAAEVPAIPRRQLMRRARKWALNCWAGGIGDTYVFAEEGNPAAMLAAAVAEKADIVVKFSAMSPFIDREMVDAMVAEFIEKKGGTQLLYSAAPPGFNYEIYSARFLQVLAQTGQTLQDILQLKLGAAHGPAMDPTVSQSFFMIPVRISSCNYRFMADSRRGVELVSALIDLEGIGLLHSPCGDAVSLLDSRPDLVASAVPREIEIELGPAAGASGSVAQEASPDRICAAGSNYELRTANCELPGARLTDAQSFKMRMEDWEKLLRDAAEYDDTRVTFRGSHDVLAGADFLRLLAFARKAGIFGLHVHTNGAGLTRDWFDSCIAADVDIVSVSFPMADSDPAAKCDSGAESADRADAPDGRARLPGCASEKSSLAVRTMLDRLGELGRPTPFVLPEMIVTKANWQWQERFFDTWFSNTGHVVLRCYDDLAGRLEDRSVMHLLPGRRRICERILTTMFVQADGRVPLCHVDGHRDGSVGRVGESSITGIWHGEGFAKLRQSHARGEYEANALCASCHSWA